MPFAGASWDEPGLDCLRFLLGRGEPCDLRPNLLLLGLFRLFARFAFLGLVLLEPLLLAFTDILGAVLAEIAIGGSGGRAGGALLWALAGVLRRRAALGAMAPALCSEGEVAQEGYAQNS